MPNARIIHTVRDPIDTCVSCFSKLFTAEQNYTYDLAELGRYLLLDELLPLAPPERHRDLHLVATAIGIAAREAAFGKSADDISGRLAAFYGCPERPGDALLRRLALDLRNGAFETCLSQERAARAILWRLTMARLRAANPQFLAANGFG